jgi:hypothetical protein
VHRAAILVLALAACGRRGFDARTDATSDATGTHDTRAIDALTGHDEDGDGIPDAIDPCPHIAGDMADADGDGVGDACDVNPSIATEHWMLFSTMQAGDITFDDITGTTQQADALEFMGDTNPVKSVMLDRARIDLGWTINALIGTGQHQIALGVDTASGVAEYYFAELNDQQAGSVHDAAIVRYDQANGYTSLDSTDPGALHTGVGYSRLDTGATHRLEEGWSGQLYDLTAATPSYTGGTKIRFAFNGLDVSIRYLAIISSN